MERWISGVLILLCLASFAASGQEAVPRLLSVQGRIADTGGTPLEGDQLVIFTIYDAALAGEPLWSSADDFGNPSTSFEGGIFSKNLGEDTGNNPIDPGIFSMPTSYLGITVGTDAEATPRQRIVSSAYALQAEQASSAVQATSLSGEANIVMSGPLARENILSQQLVWITVDELTVSISTSGRPVLAMLQGGLQEVVPDVVGSIGTINFVNSQWQIQATNTVTGKVTSMAYVTLATDGRVPASVLGIRELPAGDYNVSLRYIKLMGTENVFLSKGTELVVMELK